MRFLVIIGLALSLFVHAEAKKPATKIEAPSASEIDFQKKTGSVANNPNYLWGNTPQDSLILPILDQYVVNEVIKIRPINGHHINLKAFNNCNNNAPAKVALQEVNCQFHEAGKYKISTYICDDANTFCKFQFTHVNVTAPRGYKSALKKRVSSNMLYIPKVEIPAPATFIKNRDDFAINRAKKEGKPLYIVFSAHWCPACNMLNENVYDSKEFKDATKDFVKLILDVDSDISWDLKEKFKVGAYPTTIITTSQLNEIDRIVGYRSPTALAKWVNQAKAQEDEPIEFVISKVKQLRAAKNSDEFKQEYDQKLLRLAKWHIERGELREALELIEPVQTEESKTLKLQSELMLAQREGKKDEAAAILLNLIENHSANVNLAMWLSSYAQLKGAESQKVINKYAEVALKWIQNPKLEDTEYGKNDIYYITAEAYDSAGLSEQSKPNYKKCADEYEALGKLSKLKLPKGAPLEQAFCLVKADEAAAAIKIFEKLAKQYKTEFAFNYYYAKALQQTGDLKNALKFATQAYDYAYGDNLIRAATLKAQIEMSSKELGRAERTVSNTLEKIYLPETQNIRTHGYVAQLRSVLEKIQYLKAGQATVQ